MSKLDDITWYNAAGDAVGGGEDPDNKEQIKDLILELMSNTQGENLVAWAENLRQVVRDL